MTVEPCREGFAGRDISDFCSCSHMLAVHSRDQICALCAADSVSAVLVDLDNRIRELECDLETRIDLARLRE